VHGRFSVPAFGTELSVADRSQTKGTRNAVQHYRH
jgi:hypothetical protein